MNDFPAYKLQCDGKAIQIRLPDSKEFTLRYLSYKEFLIFKSLYEKSLVPASRVDELVAQTVVQQSLFQSYDRMAKLRAGVCTTIAGLAMFLSGGEQTSPDGFKQVLETARDEANSVDSVMFSTICSVFPAYTIEALYKLTYPEVVMLFANAERMMLDRGMIEAPFSFTGPGEERSDPNVHKDAQGRMVIPDSEVNAGQAIFGMDHHMQDEIMKEDYAARAGKPAPKKIPLSSQHIRNSIKQYNERVNANRGRVTKKRRT